MDVYQLFLAILDKPHVPKGYRDLRLYYQRNNMTNEAAALDHLIENKFEKKDATAPDRPPDSQK